MELKEQLLDALKVAVDQFNSGTEPTAAVIKAAVDSGFNSEQSMRLAEMFNNARTIYHYKHAGDKSAEFDLVDKDLVAVGIYADNPVKKSAEPWTFDHDYSQYAQPEADYTQPVEKAAEAATPLTDDTYDSLVHDAMNKLASVRDVATMATQEAEMVDVVAGTELDKVARMLHTSYLDIAHDKYGRLLAMFGKDAEWKPVLDALAVRIRPDYVPSAEKIASYGDGLIDDSDLDGYVSLLTSARDLFNKEATFLSYADSMFKEANDFEVEFYAQMNIESPFTKVAHPATEGSSPSDFLNFKSAEPFGPPKPPAKKKKPLIDVDSLFLGDAAISGMGDSLKHQISDGFDTILGGKNITRQSKGLSERLRNAQRQVMLQELITTDPVLSKEDPATVAQAYTTIMNMVPDMSMHKEVVRAILRSSVHQLAVGPFDAHQWTQVESKLRQITGKMRPTAQD
jgi:hypothetical protein